MSIVNNILNLPFPVLNHWGYWIVLIAAMLEASPLFGLFIPGQLIVIIGGFFVRLGIIDIGDTIFVAALGAILGDLIGYWLGRKYGYSFLTRFGKYFFFKKEYFDKTKILMNQHPGKTLIIGRFNSLTRAFAPFVAGSSNLPFAKFFIYNIIGGISWAITFVLAGYIFGKSYEIASKYIGRFIFIAIIVSIIFIYLYRFINKRKHIFTKYHLYALIINIFSLYLFSKMLEDIVSGDLVTKLDVWLNAKTVMIWNPILNNVMIVITHIMNSLYLVILSIILFIFLIYKKKWYYAILLVSSLLGGSLFEWLIKLIVHRARPENSLIDIAGYSFPSGHATMAIIFFSLLLYAFKDDIKNKGLKYLFIISNIILFFIIGFSRVYLNVHWLSDVLAGFALGLFWLTLLILVFKTIISLSKRTMNFFIRLSKKFLV